MVGNASPVFSRVQPGGVYTIFDGSFTTKDMFFVDSGHSSATDSSDAGLNPDTPFATLDYAIGQASANDIIYVGAGHSETLTGDGAITFDVAGITVIGLGKGSQRPTFLLDGSTAVDIAVTAADVVIKNIIFKAGHADIVECFDLSAAGFTLENVDIVDNATNENFVDVIKTTTTDNEADRLTLKNVTYISPDTGNDALIEVNGDLDRLTVEDCFVRMGVQDSEAIISMATGKDLTNARIVRNEFYRLNTAGDIVVDSDTTANSGIVAYNVVGHADIAAEVLFDITGARLFENYGTAVNDTSGYILPTADS